MYQQYSKEVDKARGGDNQCQGQQSQKTADPANNPELIKCWNRLNNASEAECHSLLKKALTPEIYEELKKKTTEFGGSLLECIQSGCENLDSGVGIYACDPKAYEVFFPVFKKVIEMYHKVDTVSHPTPTFREEEVTCGDLDPSGDMIVSTRVRVGRSHAKFGFPPVLSQKEIVEMEKVTVAALNTMDGDLKGTYYPLVGMQKDVQAQLTEDHFLFNDKDRFLKAAGGYNHWAHGRGIFHTPDKRFLVWVNEEDHMRLISMQPGGNLQEVYQRLVKAIRTLEKKLTFATHKDMGYLTFCPSNLGTALRASVHIKIPKLAAQPDFKAFCDGLNIQARGIHGEHTESVGGVYDISNKRRLGLTEFDAIEEMRKGVQAIIAKEKSL